MSKTLILALGNPILSDDAVGWKVADLLSEDIPCEQFDILKESGATFDLIPILAGYERLIVIDAIQLGGEPIGSLYKLTLEDFSSTIHISSAHDLNFATAFKMGREMGFKLPDDIVIYAIEVKELKRFSEKCTPELQLKIPEIAGEILENIICSDK